MEVELQRELNEALTATPIAKVSGSKTLLNTIKTEMTRFESNGYKGHHLTMAYKAVLTIPPTSVESERAFSAASYFCTKVRSRLNDDTLDSLCLLKNYFQLQKK